MNTNNGSMEQSSQLGHAITSTDAMVVRATDDLWIVERSVLVALCAAVLYAIIHKRKKRLQCKT